MSFISSSARSETRARESEHSAFRVKAPRSLRDVGGHDRRTQPRCACYPEIGMHSLTHSLRAAPCPVQLAAWGHPQPLEYLDRLLHFCGGFEPPDAQHHYTEKLVRLPNLGCFYGLRHSAGYARPSRHGSAARLAAPSLLWDTIEVPARLLSTAVSIATVLGD